MICSTKNIAVLGGGLAGLSAGLVLSNSGFDVTVLERDTVLGGLARTVEKNGFRFDLGGHRFFTNDAPIDLFVRDLLGEELVSVRRSSRIFLRGKYFDYPLRPVNAIFGMGLATTARILVDYGLEAVRRRISPGETVSLEDWVVGNFGRTMYEIYFKEYSEKIWGIDCRQISAEWVAQRIKGLSLAKAVKNAFFKVKGGAIPTLVDGFLYPRLGIGRLSERLAEEIRLRNTVFTGTAVVGVNHTGGRIENVVIQDHSRVDVVEADEFISSIPVTKLVTMLRPSPPSRILEAAASLRFRDLVVVAIMVDREQVTDQSWIYIPERHIPFGRIHEPTNWSREMAPAGKSIVVTEYFSFHGDPIWNAGDGQLIDLTVTNLERLGFISRREVLDGAVVRVPKAYPLFQVGYRELSEELHDYLKRFVNLHSTGRSGMFRYYNMDAAIRSGIETAQTVIGKQVMQQNAFDPERLALANVSL